MGIIPFFISMSDKDYWIREFAIRYYRTFASHCISYIERDELIVTRLFSLDRIKEYGMNHNNSFFVDDIDEIVACKSENQSGEIWHIACSAPH